MFTPTLVQPHSTSQQNPLAIMKAQYISPCILAELFQSQNHSLLVYCEAKPYTSRGPSLLALSNDSGGKLKLGQEIPTDAKNNLCCLGINQKQ